MGGYRKSLYRPQSSIELEFSRSTREADFTAKAAQFGIGLRGGNELQSCEDGLRDSGTACTLSLVQQVR